MLIVPGVCTMHDFSPMYTDTDRAFLESSSLSGIVLQRLVYGIAASAMLLSSLFLFLWIQRLGGPNGYLYLREAPEQGVVREYWSELGYNDPLGVQYARWVRTLVVPHVDECGNVAWLDFGGSESYACKSPSVLDQGVAR